MKSYRVTFFCKPGNHWRHCSEIVNAEDEVAAIEIVKKTDFGMQISGTYEVEQE